MTLTKQQLIEALSKFPDDTKMYLESPDETVWTITGVEYAVDSDDKAIIMLGDHACGSPGSPSIPDID